MTIERAAEVVDHALADGDCRVVVQQLEQPCAHIDEDESDAGDGEQGADREYGKPRRGERLGAKDVIDDELQRPGLQQVEAGDEEDLEQRPGEAPAIGAQIGQELSGELAHARRSPHQAARAAPSGTTAPSAGAKGVSSACFATVSMMPCISLPNSSVR